MANVLTDLVVKRGQPKAHLTQFNTFFVKYGTTKSKITELQVDPIEASIKEFDDIQSQIELLTDDTEKLNVFEERENYETEFFDSVAKAKGIISLTKIEASTNVAPAATASAV